MGPQGKLRIEGGGSHAACSPRMVSTAADPYPASPSTFTDTMSVS